MVLAVSIIWPNPTYPHNGSRQRSLPFGGGTAVDNRPRGWLVLPDQVGHGGLRRADETRRPPRRILPPQVDDKVLLPYRRLFIATPK
jgi:hypothetical protein